MSGKPVRGRPKVGGVTLYVRVPASVRDGAKRLAQSAGLTVSDVVRRLLMREFQGGKRRAGDDAEKR